MADEKLLEVVDRVQTEALGFSIAEGAGDPDRLNNIIDAIFSGREEIEVGIGEKRLKPFLETLEAINLVCSAKANYSGWEFEPIKHSTVESDVAGDNVTVKLKRGAIKFRQPEEKPLVQNQSAVHDAAQKQENKEMPRESATQASNVSKKTFVEDVNKLLDSISDAYKKFGKEKYGIEFITPNMGIYSEDGQGKDDESELSKEVMGFYDVKKNEVHLSKELYNLYISKEGSLDVVRSTIIHELGHAMAHQAGLDRSSEKDAKNNLTLIGKVASELLANLLAVRISADMENVQPTGHELARRLVTSAKVDYLSKDTDAAKEYLNALSEFSGKLKAVYNNITSGFDQAERKVLSEGKEVNYNALTQLYFKDAEATVRKYLGFVAVGTLASEFYGGPVLGAAKELLGGMDFNELVERASRDIESLKYVNEYLGGAYASGMARFVSEFGAIDIKFGINNMDLEEIERQLKEGQTAAPVSSRKKYEYVVEEFGKLFDDAYEMGAEILENEQKIMEGLEELNAELDGK